MHVILSDSGLYSLIILTIFPFVPSLSGTACLQAPACYTLPFHSFVQLPVGSAYFVWV